MLKTKSEAWPTCGTVRYSGRIIQPSSRWLIATHPTCASAEQLYTASWVAVYSESTCGLAITPGGLWTSMSFGSWHSHGGCSPSVVYRLENSSEVRMSGCPPASVVEGALWNS